VLEISSPGSSLEASTISGLTITGAGDSAVHLLVGSAELRDMVLTGNAGIVGGGVRADDGELLIVDTVMTDNVADATSGVRRPWPSSGTRA